MKIISITILLRYGTARARNGFLAAEIKDRSTFNEAGGSKAEIASRFKDKFTSFKRLGT
jgi:hypothetical protein